VGNIAWLSLLLAGSAWAQQSAVDKLLAEGHYGRARPLVQATLEKHPRDTDALVALSTIQWAFGQMDVATATAERAVVASDGSAAAHAQLLNMLGAKLADSRIGHFEKVGLARRFRHEADRTLQLDPRNLYAHEALARFYWYAPAIAGGSKSTARQFIQKLVQLDSVRGYAIKAELDATENNPAAVQADWQHAVASNPGSYVAQVGLAACLLAAGGNSVPAAEEQAKKSLALNPSRIASYRLLAAAHVATAQWNSLDADLNRARAAIPDDLGAEFAAAQAILDRNIASQWARAEQYLRNYLQQPSEGLEPTIAMAHWRLGMVLEKEGRKSAARNEVEAALRLDPSLDDAKKELRRLQ
jgi:tetratricopeptide (TPR) repeat protein